ncbi:4349_t:CDS:2, partial [Ambispora leptoticha]
RVDRLVTVTPKSNIYRWLYYVEAFSDKILSPILRVWRFWRNAVEKRCICAHVMSFNLSILGEKSKSRQASAQRETLKYFDRPIQDPEDVPEFIRTMIRTLHNRDEVLDILHRLEMTDDNEIFSKFKHLHGLLVLKAYLVEWRQDDEIVLK